MEVKKNPMKKMHVTVIIAILILAVAFMGLWLHERNNQSVMEQMAQSSAQSALERFIEYRDFGGDTSYWCGVANFRAFQLAFQRVSHNEGDGLIISAVYGIFTFESDISRQHIDEIISVMTVFANDIHDFNGMAQMLYLRNSLTNGDLASSSA